MSEHGRGMFRPLRGESDAAMCAVTVRAHAQQDIFETMETAGFDVPALRRASRVVRNCARR